MTLSDPLRKKGWHNFVHPLMRELTKNLRAKKKPINLNRGLKRAGMKLNDLPKFKVKDSAKPPRKGLCYKFLLGNCNGGVNCNFCHVPAEDLTNEVISKVTPQLTKLVKEGLEKLDGQNNSSNKKRRVPSGPNKLLFQE